MSKILFVYDDISKPINSIQNIVGNKHFGEIILRRRTLESIYRELIGYSKDALEFICIREEKNLGELLKQLKQYEKNTHVVHLYSNFMVQSKEKFMILLQKALYIEETMKIENAMMLFHSIHNYKEFLEDYFDNKKVPFVAGESIKTDILIDISVQNNFLNYISSGFDARYFNSLSGNEYIVTKSSTNKQKIKSEYEFYHLIPDQMKIWFVMPFSYIEEKEKSSYSMERYNMTDIALRWIHGAVSVEECDSILKKTFYFVTNRCRKQISIQEYTNIADELYLIKLDKRFQELKKYKEYKLFESFVGNGTSYNNIDEIFAEYKELYNIYKNKINQPAISVIGHGDLCFSNMLYNKEASILKLIDPKGATEEKQLWTNPYYDIAKLAHSICGRYDFFNAGLFDITFEKDLKFYLHIPFENREYVELFKKYLETNGFDYGLVRLYEASLFLSMLPLHIDNPQKVFGFLLNAIEILKEVKQCLKKQAL